VNIKQLLQKTKDDLAELDRHYKQEREKLVFVIERLEGATAETPKRGRRKNGESVPNLAEKALESRPEGLSTQALLAELKKLGYETESKNPINSVNSLLHRKGPPLVRSVDGRWKLAKYLHISDVHHHGAFNRQSNESSKVEDDSVTILISQDQNHFDTSDFTTLLLSILTEHDGYTGKELASEAIKRGWKFGEKRPATSVHFGLLNAAKRKLVEIRDGRWYIPQAKSENATVNEASKATIH